MFVPPHGTRRQDKKWYDDSVPRCLPYLRRPPHPPTPSPSRIPPHPSLTRVRVVPSKYEYKAWGRESRKTSWLGADNTQATAEAQHPSAQAKSPQEREVCILLLVFTIFIRDII